VRTGPQSLKAIRARSIPSRLARWWSGPPYGAMRPVRRTTTRQTSSRSTVRRDARPAPTTGGAASRAAHNDHNADRPRLALDQRERHIVYQTIIERQVVPRQQIVVAPLSCSPRWSAASRVCGRRSLRRTKPWVVAEPVYAVGSCCRECAALAMPQNVPRSVCPRRRPTAMPISAGGRIWSNQRAEHRRGRDGVR